MKDRVQRLRQKSLDTHPSVSIERAVLLTDFYRENTGKYPQPVLRAKAYYHLCANKTVYIGDEELIVGERGHEPKAAPTGPRAQGRPDISRDHLSQRRRPPNPRQPGDDQLSHFDRGHRML
jgi:hypothetical protein